MTEITKNIDLISTGKGAYVLFIDLRDPVTLDIPRFQGTIISPGLYLYAGSANGPGGLQARCRRQLKKNKKLHWHIDHLTTRAADIQVAAFAGGNECDLMAALQQLVACKIPVPGFGSSDCPHCSSHLLRLQNRKLLRDIRRNYHDMTAMAG